MSLFFLIFLFVLIINPNDFRISKNRVEYSSLSILGYRFIFLSWNFHFQFSLDFFSLKIKPIGQVLNNVISYLLYFIVSLNLFWVTLDTVTGGKS